MARQKPTWVAKPKRPKSPENPDRKNYVSDIAFEQARAEYYGGMKLNCLKFAKALKTYGEKRAKWDAWAAKYPKLAAEKKKSDIEKAKAKNEK